jgi:hypothetical protein
MMQDLIQNGFRLPQYTTYNAANIPFAYPPLALYLGALISTLLHIPLIEILRWLPPAVTILSIPVFYLLAKDVLASRFQAALATVAFAMLPPTFAFPNMGGGITRSIGLVLSLLTMYSALRFYTSPTIKALLAFLFSASGVVLTHPEHAWNTFAVVALFWAFKGRTKKGIMGSALVLAGVLLFTSPWWATILRNHGITPLLSAMQTGWHSWLVWLSFLKLDFSGEPYLPLITCLGVIGLVASLVRKDYFLFAWFVLPSLIEPRLAPLEMTYPLALLAARGLEEVLLPGLQALETREIPLWPRDSSSASWMSRSGKILLAFFLVYSLLNAYVISRDISSIHLTQEELEAIEWIRTNTPPQASFIVVNYAEPLLSPIQEWFPALTGRVNLAVLQGYEWLPGNQFTRRQAQALELAECMFLDHSCVEAWAEQQGLSFDYVLVSQSTASVLCDLPPEVGNSLIASMQASPAYEMVYRSATVAICRHRLGKP